MSVVRYLDFLEGAVSREYCWQGVLSEKSLRNTDLDDLHISWFII